MIAISPLLLCTVNHYKQYSGSLGLSHFQKIQAMGIFVLCTSAEARKPHVVLHTFNEIMTCHVDKNFINVSKLIISHAQRYVITTLTCILMQ